MKLYIEKIKYYFAGKAKLANAFWLLWIGGGALTVLLYLIISFFIAAAINDVSVFFERSKTQIIWLVNLYGLLASIVVWRCSNNTDKKHWTYIVRGLIIVFWIDAISFFWVKLN